MASSLGWVSASYGWMLGGRPWGVKVSQKSPRAFGRPEPFLVIPEKRLTTGSPRGEIEWQGKPAIFNLIPDIPEPKPWEEGMAWARLSRAGLGRSAILKLGSSHLLSRHRGELRCMCPWHGGFRPHMMLEGRVNNEGAL